MIRRSLPVWISPDDGLLHVTTTDSPFTPPWAMSADEVAWALVTSFATLDDEEAWTLTKIDEEPLDSHGKRFAVEYAVIPSATRLDYTVTQPADDAPDWTV